jgi:hypothetical protein
VTEGKVVSVDALVGSAVERFGRAIETVLGRGETVLGAVLCLSGHSG